MIFAKKRKINKKYLSNKFIASLLLTKNYIAVPNIMKGCV